MSDQATYSADRELAFLLVSAGQKLNDVCDVHMKPLGLTRSQWRVLAYVGRTPGISQTELAQNLELSRMAITGLLDRMQEKHLIERRDAPDDRRKKTVFLTSKSRTLASRMDQAAAVVLDGMFAGLTSADKGRLRSLLNTLKNNALILEKPTANGGSSRD